LDVEAALQEVRSDLNAAEERLSAAQAQVAELREASRGLEYALRKYGSQRQARPITPAPPTEVPEGGPRPAVDVAWLVLTREAASLRALTELGHPADTAQIADKLASVGLTVERRAVKGYMNSLKRKGLITSARPGLWDLPANSNLLDGERETDAANDSGPAEEAGPGEASDDESAHQADVITGTFGPSLPVR